MKQSEYKEPQTVRDLCGMDVYFTDPSNNMANAGIYKVAPEELQDEDSDYILLQSSDLEPCCASNKIERTQGWALPEEVVINSPTCDICKLEPIVQLKNGKFIFRAVEVAAVMVLIAGGGNTEAQTAEAMRLMSQYRSNQHITIDGVLIMQLGYYESNYSGHHE